MANNITGNPFVLDTVTDSMIPTGTVFDVFAIRWTSGSLADAISLQDAAGAVKWSATGTTASNVDETVFPAGLSVQFNGMKIPTLGAGKVYVYHRPNR
jgi:hypothetical protein